MDTWMSKFSAEVKRKRYSDDFEMVIVLFYGPMNATRRIDIWRVLAGGSGIHFPRVSASARGRLQCDSRG